MPKKSECSVCFITNLSSYSYAKVLEIIIFSRSKICLIPGP